MFFANGEGVIPLLSEMSICLLYEALTLGLEIGFSTLQVTAQSYRLYPSHFFLDMLLPIK